MKKHVIAGLVLATIGGSAASARPIRTDSAVYGDQASQRVCNATAAIASQCDGHLQCTFPVSNALCGDPAYLTVKQIRIDYRCGRRPRSAVGNEHGTLEFGCQ